MAEPTDHVNIQLLTGRNYPVVTARIPQQYVRDVDALIEDWRAIRPGLTNDQAVRYIWLKGLDALRKALTSHTNPDPDKVPDPRRTPTS